MNVPTRPDMNKCFFCADTNNTAGVSPVSAPTAPGDRQPDAVPAPLHRLCLESTPTLFVLTAARGRFCSCSFCLFVSQRDRWFLG